MTDQELKDNYARMCAELGVDRMGLGPDAPPLPPRASQAGRRRSTYLPIEEEMYSVQRMFEYGEIFPRPGLDLRTREFISIGVLTAQCAQDMLYRHINSALNIGITPEEVHEAILQASHYAGISAWEEAVLVANEVFLARGIISEGDGVEVKLAEPMTMEARKAAMMSIMKTLGIGKISHEPDAPQVQPLAGAIHNVSSTINTAQSKELGMSYAGFGFGGVWSRPALPIKLRSMLTFTALMALRSNHEMVVHFNNALNLGITFEELYEALAHAGIYVGGPGWHNATMVAAFVYQQHKDYWASKGVDFA